MTNLPLLSKLLSERFDSKLNCLEKNAKDHLELIFTSVALTGKVVGLCTNIISQLRERVLIKQRPLTSLNSSIKRQSKNGLNPKYNNSKVLQKTPLRGALTTSRTVSRFDRSGLGSKELTKSHSYGNLFNKKGSEKEVRRSNTMKVLSPMVRDGKLPCLTRGYSRIDKGDKQKRASISSAKNGNNSFKVVKVPTKAKNIKLYRKKTPYQNGRTMNNNSIERILSIDTTINNDYLLNKEEPLLLTPLTEKDFTDLTAQIEGNCFHNGITNRVALFHIEEWVDDHLITMIKYDE